MAYQLVWLEIAEDQYRSLADDLRTVVDRRLTRLRADPTGEPDVVYNEQSDQYSVPLNDRGFLFFAVVPDSTTIIVLRLVPV